MLAEDVLTVFAEVADRVREALNRVTDWGESGRRPGQYLADLDADAAALSPLLASGFGVMSEESGSIHPDREVVVVVDPLDGSTNASLGVPWFATSLCALDRAGPWVALVADQAGGARYTAIRGAGAWRDGSVLRVPDAVPTRTEAIIGLSGYPPRNLGWRQFRALGAAALDLCLVASGGLDGWVDCSHDAHGAWDYLGGMLVCREAGAAVADALGRELVTTDHATRRTPVAAGSALLRAELLTARHEAFSGPVETPRR